LLYHFFSFGVDEDAHEKKWEKAANTLTLSDQVHDNLPIRLKQANGENIKSVVIRRTKARAFHQCSPNHPSSTPVW
jgi:hypothetical protein